MLALAAAPGFAQTPAKHRRIDRFPNQLKYTLFRLPNGLTVILHEDHTVPLVTVNMWYHVGSARERPGRTGFAHLFEHLMFMGRATSSRDSSTNALESAGGDNNGSTENDRTNYWINVPSNALELALFLESDRMGYLLDTMTPQVVDAQRDVVKNERRQSVENRPYGTRRRSARRHAVSGRAPVSLAGDWLHGGPHRRELRRCGGVFQEPTTGRRTRASSWRATSTRRTPGSWWKSGSARSSRARRPSR